MVSSFNRWHRFFCQVLIIVFAVGLIPRTSGVAKASPDADVSIPKPLVDQTVWITNWKEKYSGQQRLERLIFHEVLAQQYRANPNMDPLAAVELMQKMQKDYETYVNQGQNAEYAQLREKDWYIRAALDVVKDLPGASGVAIGTGKALYEKFVDKAWTELDSANQIVAADRRYGFYKDVMPREDAILKETMDLAQSNPKFATAFDMLHMGELNASIADPNASKVIEDNPEIKVPNIIKIKLQPDGRVLISLNELKQLAQNEFASLHAGLDEIQASLKSIDDKQNQIIDWMNNETARQQAQAEAAAEAARHKLMLEGAQSSLYIVSTLIGFIDPQAGRYVSVIGASTIQIVTSVNQWLETISSLGSLDMLGAMSTAVMTGNVLGAVLNIVSLFSTPGPTPEQMILEAVGQLRQQVSELRTEMHGRFDRIDQSLNLIYDSMMSEFNKIDLQLWRISGNIHDIQSTLIAMELQLNRMERNTYEFLDVQGRRPLLESINGAIGYQERTGLAMPYQPDYIGYENTFYSWGATHAFDALSAGPTSRDYSDRQVLAELSNYPLDANVNYLNGWLIAHGLQPFAQSRLPGMRDWSLSSSAYSQMTAEWPGHARQIAPARVETLNMIGDTLNESLRAISTLDTAEGPRGNMPLFRGVLDYYKAKAAQLDTALTNHEAGFVGEIQRNLPRAESFNLWGGDAQSLSYVNPAFNTTINACGRTQDTSVSSPNIRDQVEPQILFSDYLKQRELSICYTASWQETEFREIPKSDHSTVWAKLETRVHVRLADVRVHSFVYRDPEHEYIGSTQDPWRADAYSRTRSSWGSVRPKIETAASHDRNAAEIEATVNAVRGWLFGKQRELYASIFGAMNSGSLKGPTEELAGAKLLLDSFVALGLPLAAEHDDYLRSFAGGEQRLVDQYIVMQTYAQAAGQPDELPLLTVNPRSGLKATIDKRFGALDSLIMSYLAKISAGEHSEHFGRIDNVQLELTITDWLARTNDKYRVLIPLIRK